MTIGELIDLLRTYPTDLRVVVDGYEDGFDDLSTGQLSMVKVGLNTGAEVWEGDHIEARYLTTKPAGGGEVVEVLALRRTSH